jgi:NAD-dependent deacetylase
MDQRILFFTGAGISAESGIPTFQGESGLWNNYDINEVCQYSTWLRNYDKVHTFYNEMRADLKLKEPNHAHKTIAKLQQEFPDKVTIITQNVDDLFERAGCLNVHHLHGEVTKMRCCKCNNSWNIGYQIFDYKNASCPYCNKSDKFKPDIIFFGERAPKYGLLEKLLMPFFELENVVIVIGSSGTVVPIDDIIGSLPCKKILNNLEASESIKEDIYDKIYYEEATIAIDKITLSITKNR